MIRPEPSHRLPRRRTVSLALLAVCALSAGLALASPAVAAHAKRPRCRLSGPNLAHSSRIKVVKTKNADGLDVLRACARPNGRVFTIEEAQDEGLGTSTVDLDRVAGIWITSTVSDSNQYGGGLTLSATNVRTGHSYALVSSRYSIGSPGSSAYLDRALIDSHGDAAIAVGTARFGASEQPQPGTEEIDAFAPDGTKLVLDSADGTTLPGSSLSFDHGVVSWTHGGMQRTARFG
jgi:hypothetical protein